MHCDFCDQPMDVPEHDWDRSCSDDKAHTMGLLRVKDSLGHEWSVEYDIQGGERSDHAPMRMFVKMTVDGHAYGDVKYGNNLYVSGGSLKTTTTSEFETLTGLLSGKDEWDFDPDDQGAMDRYSEDCRALRDAIEQVEAALTAFAEHTPSVLVDGSLMDELVEGQRRHEEKALRDEMEGAMYRLEEELAGLDLDNKEKATVLRRLADKLESEG